jgi:hypothetical protein
MDDETALYHKQRGVTGLPMFDHIAIARDADAKTSHAGADHIAPKRGTQMATLLEVYRAYGPLTDREASEKAGLPTGWKRCADLRRAGLIRPNGDERGTPKQMVCEIAS